MAGKIYKAGMSLLVIDTENKFVSTGFAKEIARVAQGASTETFIPLCIWNVIKYCHCFYLAGKYYYLPNASDAVISATTKEALSALKSS